MSSFDRRASLAGALIIAVSAGVVWEVDAGRAAAEAGPTRGGAPGAAGKSVVPVSANVACASYK